MLGSIISAVGGLLLAIVGLIYLAGSAPMPWLRGLTALVLGVGLVLFMSRAYTDESGREAREQTESRRVSREVDKGLRDQADSHQQQENAPK